MAKILIVDDEPDIVALIERALEGEGFTVIAAFDGIGALDIAETERPDMVLLDVMMPMMSGYEVCQQLKSNPLTREIPVVCITSAHNEDTRRKAAASGAQALLVKPFMPAELVAQVNRHLTHAREKAAARQESRAQAEN